MSSVSIQDLTHNITHKNIHYNTTHSNTTHVPTIQIE